MNTRQLLNRLSIIAAVAMVLATLAYRSEARSQPAAAPPVPVLKQDPADDKKDGKEAHSQQQLSKQELAGRNPHQVQQQKRVERLQLRL